MNNSNKVNLFKNKPSYFKYLIMVILLVIVLNPFTLLQLGMFFTPNPPEPTIEYGEFPFKLTYEFNGETIVYSDTIICVFNGIQYGGSGKEWDWLIYSKNTGDSTFTIIDVSSFKEHISKNKNHFEYDKSAYYKYNEDYIIESLYFYVGTGNYYMGDNSYSAKPPQDLSYVMYEASNLRGDTFCDFLSLNDAYEKFGFRFINWECAPPIENEFK